MARKRFLGTAADQAQTDSITFAGAWAAADTIDMTVGGGTLRVKVASATTATIATEVTNAINAVSATDNLDGTEERFIRSGAGVAGESGHPGGGQEIPEFQDISASVSTANTSRVLVRSVTAGVPFTLAISKTTATSAATATLAVGGDGTSETVAATGKNWFNNADNWDTGAAPANSDLLVFQGHDVDCLYGLNSSLTGIRLVVENSYSGRIGLPLRNPGGYTEYRDRYLKPEWANATGAIRIGEGSTLGPGPSLVNLDLGSTTQTDVVIASTGSPETGERSVVNLIDGNSSTVVTILSGSLSLGEQGNEDCSIGTLRMGTRTTASDATVHLGDQATVGTLIEKNGGSLNWLIQSPSTETIVTFTQWNGTAVVGGNLLVTTLNCNGGTLEFNAVTTSGATAEITTLNLRGAGIIDFGKDSRAKTVTTINKYTEESQLLDPLKILGAAVVQFHEIRAVGVDWGTDATLTRS